MQQLLWYFLPLQVCYMVEHLCKYLNNGVKTKRIHLLYQDTVLQEHLEINFLLEIDN
jgi:hypothetical protein